MSLRDWYDEHARPKVVIALRYLGFIDDPDRSDYRDDPETEKHLHWFYLLLNLHLEVTAAILAYRVAFEFLA